MHAKLKVCIKSLGLLSLYKYCCYILNAWKISALSCGRSNQKELIYTYDGLYEVTAANMETGQEGFKICK